MSFYLEVHCFLYHFQDHSREEKRRLYSIPLHLMLERIQLFLMLAEDTNCLADQTPLDFGSNSLAETERGKDRDIAITINITESLVFYCCC